MKVLIPAKACSTRCVNKNFRPFYGDDSLVDLLVEKLRDVGFKAKDMYVATECGNTAMQIRQRHAVNVIIRNMESTYNTTRPTDYLPYMAHKIGGWTELAIAMCTVPTFDGYASCMDQWKHRDRKKFTSLAVAQPAPNYIMMRQGTRMVPISWSFGNMHDVSQDAAELMHNPFAFNIVTRKAFDRYGYYFTPNCIWHIENDFHIDINTTQEFFDAQAVYAARASKNPERNY